MPMLIQARLIDPKPKVCSTIQCLDYTVIVLFKWYCAKLYCLLTY